jgi:hypothetical protein
VMGFSNYVGWISPFWLKRWDLPSWIFDISPHPNGPSARHRPHGFPSKPSKIMHWMYQVNWDGFEAMVWTIYDCAT